MLLLWSIGTSSFGQTSQQVQAAAAEQDQAYKAQALVEKLLKSEVARDVAAQISLFAPRVISEGKSVSREALQKEITSNFKRWPKAQWALLSTPAITKHISSDEFEVTYRASYRVESSERKKWSQGILTSKLSLKVIDNKLLIAALHDETSATSKGDLGSGETTAASVTSRNTTLPVTNGAETSKKNPIAIVQQGAIIEESAGNRLIACISPNGQNGAIANDGTIILTDCRSRVEIFRKRIPSQEVIDSISFNQESNLLIVMTFVRRGGDYVVHVFSVDRPDVNILPLKNNGDKVIRDGKPVLIRRDSLEAEGPPTLADLTSKNIRNISFHTSSNTNRDVVLNIQSILRNSASALDNRFITTSAGPIIIGIVNGTAYATSLFSCTSVNLGAAIKIHISEDMSHLAIESSDRNVSVFDVNGFKKTFAIPDCGQFRISSKGNILAFINNESEIEIANANNSVRTVIKNTLTHAMPRWKLEYSELKISPSGRFLAVVENSMAQSRIQIIDAQTKQPIATLDQAMSPCEFSFTNDIFAFNSGFSMGEPTVRFVSLPSLHELYSCLIPVEWWHTGEIHFSHSENAAFVARGADRTPGIIRIAYNAPQRVYELNKSTPAWDAQPSHDGNSLYCRDTDFFASLRAATDGSTNARFLMYSNGGVIALDPQGFYFLTDSNHPPVAFRIGENGFPFEQFDLRLNRPDIVLNRLGAPPEAITIAKELREKRLKRMEVTEDMLKPDFHLPEISFAKELPVAADSRDLSLQINATDSKYPLERLRVYVNDVPVNGKDGESLRSLNTQSLDRTIPVNLSAGKNKIQVSVLNSAGAESLYATAEVNCTAPAAKPNLYLVAMGVSNYANQQFNLKYAAKDAEDLAAKLKARAGNAYGEVKELLLKDGEVTKDSLVKVREFLKPATVDDSVVLFMAGHGLLDDKYDYYFGTSDMDFNNPAGRGIAFDDMDDILADLPSRKKSLLIDTCHAGELDADEKKVLAAADAAASGAPVQLASNKSVAVRSVGTRGMAVKGIEGAKGKSEWYERISGMFVDLRRGSGSTILSSSAGAEYAFESGEQKNGLFTYAVLEALDGKNDADTDKDGKVTMKELCESVKKRVQGLSGGKQTPNTRRLNLESDFTVATAGPPEPTMLKPQSANFIK